MHAYVYRFFFFVVGGDKPKHLIAGWKVKAHGQGLMAPIFFFKVEWGEKNTLDAVQHRVKELKVITGAAARGRRLGVHAR